MLLRVDVQSLLLLSWMLNCLVMFTICQLLLSHLCIYLNWHKDHHLCPPCCLYNQVVTIWGKSLASRWAWVIRTLLPSLVATPWFVTVHSCFFHNGVIHSCIDVAFLSFSLGKVPQGAVWFWGGLDKKPVGLWQLLLQVSLQHVSRKATRY